MKTWTCAALALIMTSAAAAQPTAPHAAAQRASMERLAMLDGAWRGKATVIQPGGTIELIHTERVGPMLDGALRVIEGKSYRKDGSPGGFNAFAVVSYDAAKDAYVMRSYAGGHAGDFPLTVRDDGFEWQMPTGSGAVIRHVAKVAAGHWHEDSMYEAAGKPPIKVFTMDLERVGDSLWPADGAVPQRP